MSEETKVEVKVPEATAVAASPEVIVAPVSENTQKVVVEVKPVHAEPAPPPPKKKGLIRKVCGGCFHAIIAVVLFPFRSFRHRPIDQITVYSATPGFFLWLLIFTGFIFSGLTRWQPNLADSLGWLYTWTIIYFFASLLYDINAKRLALWVIVFLCVWFGLKYVEHVRHWMVLGSITSHLSALSPQYDPGQGSFIAWVLLIPFGYSIFNLFANGRKRFSPNEVSEFHFLDGNEMTDRMGLRFRTKYRDVLETLLAFGGGDIVATNNHQVEIKRYSNVLFLWFIWPKLDKILNQRAVIEGGEEDDVTHEDS